VAGFAVALSLSPADASIASRARAATELVQLAFPGNLGDYLADSDWRIWSEYGVRGLTPTQISRVHALYREEMSAMGDRHNRALADAFARDYPEKTLRAWVGLFKTPTARRYVDGASAVSRQTQDLFQPPEPNRRYPPPVLTWPGDPHSRAAAAVIAITVADFPAVEPGTKDPHRSYIAAMVPFYVKQFSESELQDIAAFLSSPAYRDYWKARNAVVEIASPGPSMGRDAFDRALARVKKEPHP
jgi:hypothetical protein